MEISFCTSSVVVCTFDRLSKSCNDLTRYSVQRVRAVYFTESYHDKNMLVRTFACMIILFLNGFAKSDPMSSTSLYIWCIAGSIHQRINVERAIWKVASNARLHTVNNQVGLMPSISSQLHFYHAKTAAGQADGVFTCTSQKYS